MQQYIAVLDHEHLENSLFLTAFAKALSQHKGRRGIILHGDSEYTDRILQSGVMRQQAQIRATKDLNRRLIGLFADQGVSTVGLHCYQRGLVQIRNEDLVLNHKELNRIPSVPCLLLSNLIEKNGEIIPAPLPELSRLFTTQTNSEIVLFSINDRDELLGFSDNKKMKWDEIKGHELEKSVPKEFNNFHFPVTLTTAAGFENWPESEKMVKIT